jgi:tRNA (guanine-N7-)-methyltransferase
MGRAENNETSRRTIRSFVRRAGRLTPGQKKAIETLLPKYGIECREIQIDLDTEFGRRAPHIMEIGFGNGELLVEMAASHPENDYIGVEVHEPGVGRCLSEIEQRELSNARVICLDAIEILRTQLADDSLDGVCLFFPDPWPKKRHHKRRIVQAGFIELLARKIRVGGFFRTATDWAEYADHIQVTVAASSSFEAIEMMPEDRCETKFEQRGKRLGHNIWEHVYRCI